ncbi:hypothetical protein GCM10008961_05230 [Deinococcus knuensis]|uniref:Uncharacterized protein n=1 Tax=Deinococcus knuensis TaxID=1837380 RepID=A0ABQ2SC88_9DEIO|nr:hypothetical protein GCM10008961_05230 [Deinococcus knuensis]
MAYKAAGSERTRRAAPQSEEEPKRAPDVELAGAALSRVEGEINGSPYDQW